MSTRGEKSLAVKAHQQIGICCETLCDKEIVQAYIQELEERIKKLEERLDGKSQRSSKRI